MLVAAPGQDGTNYDGGAGYSGGGAGFGDYIFGDGGQDGGDGEDGDGKGHGGAGSGLGLKKQLISLDLPTNFFYILVHQVGRWAQVSQKITGKNDTSPNVMRYLKKASLTASW